MSETAEQVNPDVIPAEVIVTRPGGSVKYVPTAFKRGDNAKKGLMYLAIAAGTTFAEKIAHIGEKDADAMLTRTLNLFAQNWHKSATTGVGPDGKDVRKPFDLAEFVGYATDLSARGMSKAELVEAIAAGWDELQAVLRDTAMAPADKMPLLEKLGERMKMLNNDLASRGKKDDDSDETPATT